MVYSLCLQEQMGSSDLCFEVDFYFHFIETVLKSDRETGKEVEETMY